MKEVYAIYVNWGEGKPEIYSETVYMDVNVANEQVEGLNKRFNNENIFFVKPLEVE